MQMSLTRAPWPRSFLVALELAGAASARLPFGMPDPILRGASAVALYTGGLWPVTALELTVANPGRLVAELFAIGCRWACGAGVGDVRHPNCEIGIDIRPDVEPATPPELANQLRLALDHEASGWSGVATLKVVGIEDLVVEQIRCWLLDGGPSGEQANVLQALVASARAGAGGPLRTNYLQRRLALETQGEVCIDDLPLEAGRGPVGTPRSIGLIEMKARIQTWWALQGLALDTVRPIGPAGSGNTPVGAIGRGGHDGLDLAGRGELASATILPFGSARVGPPVQG
jgi:hypothetical protein